MEMIENNMEEAKILPAVISFIVADRFRYPEKYSEIEGDDKVNDNARHSKYVEYLDIRRRIILEHRRSEEAKRQRLRELKAMEFKALPNIGKFDRNFTFSPPELPEVTMESSPPENQADSNPEIIMESSPSESQEESNPEVTMESPPETQEESKEISVDLSSRLSKFVHLQEEVAAYVASIDEFIDTPMTSLLDPTPFPEENSTAFYDEDDIEISPEMKALRLHTQLIFRDKEKYDEIVKELVDFYPEHLKLSIAGFFEQRFLWKKKNPNFSG